MRIVYFLPDIDAGVAQIVRALLKYKAQNNDQYVVVLFSSEDYKSNHSISDFEGANEIIRFSYSVRENLYAVYKRLANVLHTEQDIIVSNDGWEIRMVAALKLKNPVAYIVHGDFDYYYLITKLNESIIDLFIAYSDKVYEELKEKKLLPENHYKVQKIYYPSAVLDGRSLATNRKSSSFKILFAGTLDRRKGAHLLKGIYDKLVTQIDSFQMCIIGDGDLKDEVASQFSGCANVFLKGWQPNEYVIQEMSSSNDFLFPSFSEGLPNVLIEALFSGAVPVSSKLESGVQDIIEDKVNGVLVETGNVKGYGDAIVNLYNDKSLLDRLRQRGKTGLIEKFEPHQQASLYDKAIKQLALKEVTKDYPKYSIGGWLNKPWLPNFFVKTVRSVIKHQKL